MTKEGLGFIFQKFVEVSPQIYKKMRRNKKEVL